MMKYDEARNLSILASLNPRLRAAFALLCSGRLLPMYAAFAMATGRGDPEGIRRLWDLGWSDVLGPGRSSAELAEAATEAEHLIPEEDDGEYHEDTQPYAEDAVAALAYAFWAGTGQDPKHAAWAGRRLYEATDHWAGKKAVNAYGTPEYEAEVLAHPVVQRELTRQDRDLADLVAVPAAASGEYLTRLRARCLVEGGTVLDP